MAALLITPDRKAQTAMGSNPLDPQARERAAEAGLAQAQREQSRLTHIWPQRR